MNHKNKKSIMWMKNLLWFSFILFCVFAISCEDDNEIDNPYVRIAVTTTSGNDSIVGNDYVFKVKQKETSQYFAMYSNIGDWILSVEENNQDWVAIWPAEGSNDGRFGVRVLANEHAATRKASIYIIDSEGKVQGSIPIEQTGSAPYMDIEFTGTEKRASYTGEEFSINVSANIAWYADNGGTDWIQIGEATETSQKIIIGANTGTQERTGTLTFNMVGGTKKVAIQIIQADKSSSYELATLTTISALLSKLGGAGTISDNVYIEAYVTNDITTKSIVSFSNDKSNWIQQTKLMTVQDESKRGLLFEFDSENNNTYKLNDKLKIHMYGMTLSEDSKTGDIKIGAFSPVNVKEQIAGSSGVTPVELDNMDDLDNYPNTLVTLKNVEFTNPYGTYMNIQETEINKIATNWTTTADVHTDNTSDYGHVLRDKNGNLLKLYTAASFTEKYTRIMPKGSGSITGIVMKRIKNNVKSNILRIRSNNDNKISDDPSTAISTEIMRIGPWETKELLSGVSATVGTGTLTQTSRAAQNVITSGGTDYMYWADSYQRITAGETSIMQMINNQTWWNTPASILTDQQGEAWVITTSTAGQSATGKLFLQFITSSSTTGPGIFTIEWAESTTAPAANWKAIQDFYVCDVNNSKHRMQYCFKLPDEMKNKSNVVIRLRVKANIRATDVNGTSTIGGSGSNCIGSIRITQLKN